MGAPTPSPESAPGIRPGALLMFLLYVLGLIAFVVYTVGFIQHPPPDVDPNMMTYVNACVIASIMFLALLMSRTQDWSRDMFKLVTACMFFGVYVMFLWGAWALSAGSASIDTLYVVALGHWLNNGFIAYILCFMHDQAGYLA